MEILVLPDLHFPFHHKKALAAVLNRLSEHKFNYIIQIGDLLDQYCFSNFPKKNLRNADREIKFGRECAQNLWHQINKLQKKAKKIQLLGNHDIRLIKRCQERLPEAQDLIKLSLFELYRFDNVKTVEDPREELFIGDIAFLHGYRSKLGDHTKYMQMNTVHGHTHRGGVFFTQVQGKTLWELDCGYLADSSKEPLAYQDQKTNNWTLGFAEINNGVPRFVPYLR